MYIVTTASYNELGALIREKRVSLDNGRLMFGQDTQVINRYFKERIGYDGYVIGLRGRLNKTTASIFSKIDECVLTGDSIIIEAEVDDDDLLRYTVDGINTAAEALTYGLDEDDVRAELDRAQKMEATPDGVEVLCVPYLKIEGNLKVTSLTENIDFNVEGITFVKLKKD